MGEARWHGRSERTMEVSTESERTMEVSTESELFRTTLHEVEASFDIGYGGFLSNHFLHGLVAVARLGADEARFKAFVEAYKQHTVLGHELESEAAHVRRGWKQLE